MKIAVVWMLAGLFLVAAGEGEKKPVERDGLLVWPAVTEAYRAKVEVPVWNAPAAQSDEAPFVEVVVAGDESVWCGGVSVDLADLRKQLAAHADRKRDRSDPVRPSTVPVLIHAAKGTRWRILQFVMMCAAMPEVRMYRIYLSMQDGKGAPVLVPCFLPLDRGQYRPKEPTPTITLELKRKKGEEHTRVKLLDQEIGIDDEGFRVAAERIAQIAKMNRKLPGQINAWAWVPYEHVVRGYAGLRNAGVKEVAFTGAPAPSALLGPDGNRKLDEPPEIPLPGEAEVARITGELPLVRRGSIVVHPGDKPAARKTILLPDWPLPAVAPKERQFLEVLVKKDGRLIVGGKEVNLKHLTMKLLVWAERSRDLAHPQKPSNMPVLFHASRDVRWREMQWVMQAAADPDVRIWKIYFATRTKDGKFAYVPVFLPMDRKGRADLKVVRVELKRKKDDASTRVKFLDEGIGAGDTAFFLLRKYLAEVKKSQSSPFYGEINAWAWTPFQDVVHAMSAFHAAKIEPLTFVGAPPPGKRPK